VKRNAVARKPKGAVLRGVTWDFTPASSVPVWETARSNADGLKSSVITSALCWVMKAFPEAPVVVEKFEDEQWKVTHKHALTKLLRTPNPFYGGRVLWMATAMDFCFGEAFWLKVRNGADEVVELWWVPRALMVPRWDDLASPGVFVTHYEYTVAGRTITVAPRDVVHFRFGMDPANTRRGFSPLASVMRDVYIDDQASNFTAAILKNLGIIGVVFSPKAGMIPKDQAERLKETFQRNQTGEKRAQAMVVTGPMDVELMHYNLQGFDVGPLRDISEERVCAALSIQPAVVGFGTGLQQTKVGATMKEVVKLSWEQGIEPNQAICADEMDRSLLPEFQGNTALFRTRFDTSVVDAINESKSEKTDRVTKLTGANIITIAQAQRELGYPVDNAVNKYLRELSAPAAPPKAPDAQSSSDAGGTDAAAQ
jgi:phage portal protein BeeE